MSQRGRQEVWFGFLWLFFCLAPQPSFPSHQSSHCNQLCPCLVGTFCFYFYFAHPLFTLGTFCLFFSFFFSFFQPCLRTSTTGPLPRDQTLQPRHHHHRITPLLLARSLTRRPPQRHGHHRRHQLLHQHHSHQQSLPIPYISQSSKTLHHLHQTTTASTCVSPP